MLYAGQDMKDHFMHYKATHTFETRAEAEQAMHHFLRKLEESGLYSREFTELMAFHCRKAMEHAANVPFPTELSEDRTCEWRIDPTGVALECRSYKSVYQEQDEEDIMAWEPDKLYLDYEVTSYLGLSTVETVSLPEAIAELGIPYPAIDETIQQWPMHAVHSTVGAISEARISKGAILYYKSVSGTQDAPAWPEFRATKSVIKVR